MGGSWTNRTGTGRAGMDSEIRNPEEDVELRWYSFGFPNQVAASRHPHRLASRLSTFRLTLCSLSPILESRFHSRNASLAALFPPAFLSSPMPLPKDSTLQGPPSYHGVGDGPSSSQRSRKFRSPVVYSNPLVDLCAYYLFQTLCILTISFITVTTGTRCSWNA